MRHCFDNSCKAFDFSRGLFTDQKSWEGFYKRAPETGVSQEDMDRYLANNGKEPPLFVKADTIEAVAKLADINADNLKATVNRYNAFVKAKGDKDFQRPVEYVNNPCLKAEACIALID